MKPHLLVVALAVVACHRTPRANVGELAAVVENPSGLALARGAEGALANVASLPSNARAFRFSPDGRQLAWVEDEPPRMRVEALVDGRRELVATDAEFRKREAFGLAIDNRGHVFMSREVVVGRDGHHASVKGDCLDAPSLALASPLCGDALKPLSLDGQRALVRTNAELMLVATRDLRSIAMTDVIEAELRDGDEALVLQRSSRLQQVDDVLLVVSPWPVTHEILRAPLIVSARWDASGNVVAIRRADRLSLVATLLAHAPDEFGGEAVGGQAVHVDVKSGATTPVRGLESRLVRALAIVR